MYVPYQVGNGSPTILYHCFTILGGLIRISIQY